MREKKKLGFKRVVSNNTFALKTIWEGSPVYLIVYLASSVIYGALGFLSETYLLRKIVNGAQKGEDIGRLSIYLLVIGIVCVVVYQSLRWFWYVVSPPKQRKIAANIEKKLFSKAANVELSCYETTSFYDKYVRAMDEAYDRIIKVMWSLDGLIDKLINLSANTLLLFIIDPWLIVFGLLPLLLGFFKRMENTVSHEHQTEVKQIDRRVDYVNRTFYLGEYAKEMRIGGMYLEMFEALKNTFEDYKALAKKHGLKKAALAYVQTVGLEVVTILGATVYAVWSAMCIGPEAGGMQVGDCIVVLSSIGTISHCLNNIVQNLAEFGEHALFLEDVRYFLDYTPLIVDGNEEIPSECGDLEIRNLSFKYDGAEKEALNNVSFTLHKGERVAIVGSNGSGKTTLVKLLLRLYDPSSGTIVLNNKNIKKYRINEYRRLFSTVFQDFKMFSLNVYENVLLRPLNDNDKNLVITALKQGGIYDRLNGLENGLDSVLTKEFDDKGVNLSVGEQQKLSLSRAFAETTPFVILDEPSSALDPIAEYKMFENMMRATVGRSVIFVSHRLSSAVLADRVILLENGNIAEIGTHNELLRKNGKYAEMFFKQAENYLGEGVKHNA